MNLILIVVGIYAVWAWFMLRGAACFFCGRALPSSCRCPGSRGKS